jgi:hypothetical protein
MTPAEFLERNPNWRDDARDMVGSCILEMIRDEGIPMPWTDETLRIIEETATEATIDVFRKYRDQMGDAVFGELTLFVGQEAKRIATAARDEAAPPTRTLQ